MRGSHPPQGVQSVAKGTPPPTTYHRPRNPNRRAPAGWPNHRRRSVQTIVDAEFRLWEIDIEGGDGLFDSVETFEEEAERIADEARMRAALQLAKDVLAGEFDPERVEFRWAVPQIFSYPWRDPETGHVSTGSATRHTSSWGQVVERHIGAMRDGAHWAAFVSIEADLTPLTMAAGGCRPSGRLSSSNAQSVNRTASPARCTLAMARYLNPDSDSSAVEWRQAVPSTP